ncbi:MAG: type I DNA topoisomerase, partial [Candidatus Omnitrophota bacterium]
MKKSLVIVESPAKSKTLGKFLGADYEVCASMGHLIDLPSNNMGVDIEKKFAPNYVVIPARRKLMAELRKKAKKKTSIYLATDPDREGEAISWHLARELKNKEAKCLRVEFHEITKSAIQNAFKSPREIDMGKVDAQQARRILDRIVGYNLSPLLWQKVGKGLSAGRVQSVALRLIVEREREIKAFIPQEYWEIEADLKKLKGTEIFKAKLNAIDGKKPEMAVQDEVDKLVSLIKENDFVVDSVKEQKKTKMPPQPYTTSKMQQDAFNKLRFQASRTMKLAQQLYEGLDIGEEGATGLITYMRTDSIRISDEAKTEVKKYILSKYGEDYVSNVSHKKKTKQKTQDAHEAIRPTSVERTPDEMKQYLNPSQHKLYSLIWKRFVQSEMAKAQIK